MGIREGAGNVGQDVGRSRHRQLALAGQPGPERLARDERHGVVEMAGGLAGGEQRNDVRMVQRGRDVDLEAEAVGAHPAGQLGGENFDHDLAPERLLGRHEHARHTAAAELALDGVGAAEGGFQIVPKAVGQGELRKEPARR